MRYDEDDIKDFGRRVRECFEDDVYDMYDTDPNDADDIKRFTETILYDIDVDSSAKNYDAVYNRVFPIVKKAVAAFDKKETIEEQLAKEINEFIVKRLPELLEKNNIDEEDSYMMGSLEIETDFGNLEFDPVDVLDYENDSEDWDGDDDE